MKAINPMDIKAEKLYIIEQLARLEDKQVIEKIKALLHRAPDDVAGYTPSGEAIRQAELIQRAEASNKAIKEGRYTSIDDLEKESANW